MRCVDVYGVDVLMTALMRLVKKNTFCEFFLVEKKYFWDF
jgi:hypothetical protein